MPADNNKRGVALILVFIVIAVLAILGVAVISSTVSDSRIAQRYMESTAAFWLAEAGINQALQNLRVNYNASSSAFTALGEGGYSFNISDPGNGTRVIVAHGFIPSEASPRAERTIEAIADRAAGPAPLNFYNNAIYAAGPLIERGTITGPIRYGSTIDGASGTETSDSSITPLAALDYAQLRAISQSQGNYHDASHLNGPFPATFYKSPGVPNVVFLEGSLTLKGNDSVAGFFVVGGEVTYDATIAGNVSVDGCIYTRGNFTIKGGGGAPFNVKGLWVGGTTTLGGSSVIQYDAAYMAAIQALNINTVVQIKSWQDTQNPYTLTP